MKRFLIFSRALFLMHLRNGAVLFWNLAMPLFLMLIYGLMAGQMSPGLSTKQAMTYLTPGVIVLNTLSFGLVSSSTFMLDLREKGVLFRLRATPLPAGQLVLAYLLVNLALVMAQSSLILLSGIALYGVSVTPAGLLLGLPMLLAAVVAFLALGAIISGAAPRAGVATGAGMTVYFGLMFVSDLIMPLQMMPVWVQNAAPWLPSYLAVSLLRAPLLDSALDPQALRHLVLLAAYSLGAALVAARLFRWEPRA